MFDVQFKGRNREGVWFGSQSFAYLKSGAGMEFGLVQLWFSNSNVGNSSCKVMLDNSTT